MSHVNDEYLVSGEHSHENDLQLIADLNMENWCRLEALNLARFLYLIYLDGTERYKFNILSTPMLYVILNWLALVRDGIVYKLTNKK